MIHKGELPQFLRFACVGVANTLVHLAVVVFLVESVTVAPAIANATAFLFANLGSYLLNSTWTFRGARSVYGYMRFFAVSLVGLAMSWGIVLAAQILGQHYLVGVLVSVSVVAVLGYFLNKYFVFGR